ncbi:juvenile hormone esterase-like isoform X1 [Galleria mellonella]|uniref:Carboxylic ester hydrolase n=1 Tax=Galleria mellonella TaxID=7137 RepID=A0A6J1WA24_GALME|nr:juvenile hormone esterase-like isoform X1 [Galleria mellonella]XP_031769507.2 juvenile hormone esterase-like isoform X1 [Galleria mellonella]
MSIVAMCLLRKISYCRISFVLKRNLSSNPIVRVEQGKLKGSTHNLLDGSPYYSFKGISYAQPPVGELRFKAPLPPKSWEGVCEVIKHGPVCPQFDTLTSQRIEGNEDCLFLNVYTKSLAPSDKLPVMVFIHGGAYLQGSGNSDAYGPDFLLQHDVILVTLNYRLDLLGFLNLDIPEVSGNAGLKDQVAALKWIKSNIDKFGGDSNNITLFGESSGGVSVTCHLISPMSNGLFNKAIAQSGTCLDDWVINRDAKSTAFRVGKILGKHTDNPKELLKFLQSVPATDLLGLTFKIITEEEKNRGLPLLFTPVIEKKFDNVKSFLSVDPLDALVTGDIGKFPIITGYNSSESISMIGVIRKKANFRSKHPEYLVPKEIMYKVSTEKMKEFGECIKRFYVGDKDFTAEVIEAQIDMLSDIYYIYNNSRFVHLYSKSDQPIYQYVLDYDTDLNSFKKLFGMSHVKGMCHTEDLLYLFSSKSTKELYKEQERVRELVFTLTKLWTNFAKTSDPTPDQSLGVKWKPYTTTGEEYLHIGEPLMLEHAANRERVEFWNQLYCEAGLPHIDTHKS